MGWRGAIRSMNAAARRMEREQEREERQHRKAILKAAKEQYVARNASIVDSYEQALDRLLNAHRAPCDPFDWEEVFEEPEPNLREPMPKWPSASRAFMQYEPSLWETITFQQNKIRANLKSKMNMAQIEDRKEQERYEEKKRIAMENWSNGKRLAAHVLKGEYEHFGEAFQFTNRLQEADVNGRNLHLSFENAYSAEGTFYALGLDKMPESQLKMLRNGDVSTKDLSESKRNDIHRQYVCSSILRIAMEVLSVMPIDVVLLHVSCEILNDRNGRIEESPILSVCVPTQSLEKIEIENTNPVSAMQNFVFRMEYGAKSGFKPIMPMSFRDFSH